MEIHSLCMELEEAKADRRSKRSFTAKEAFEAETAEFQHRMAQRHPALHDLAPLHIHRLHLLVRRESPKDHDQRRLVRFMAIYCGGQKYFSPALRVSIFQNYKCLTHTHTNMHAHTDIYIYIYAYICIHMYTYVYKCIHMYTYVYICIQKYTKVYDVYVYTFICPPRTVLQCSFSRS